MIHQPLISGGGITGQATDIQIEAAEMMKVKKMFIKIMSDHTGQDIKKVEQDMERNNWMTPEDALKYGLIDKIIK
jgi:ATP-dependent Clp protease, protease subunit